MVRRFWLLGMWLIGSAALGQTIDFRDLPKKGSYLYYGQPAFEDNSFLVDEAINQEKGIMQYISNLYLDNVKGGNLLYSFNQEIPITHLRHQVSYTLYYHIKDATATGENSSGFGDLNIGYHYMVSGKKDWAMVVPGVNIIVPTGKAVNGQGAGGLGGQLSVAITKRISHRIITHYNLGYTFISKADHYTSTLTPNPLLSYERDLHYSNLGAGVVWYPSRKFNLFLEYVSNFLSDIKDDGSVSHTHQMTFNPGLRFAIDHKLVQIVPGISAPLVFSDGNFSRSGIFFYLSFEGEYLPFTKPKSR